MIQVEENKSAPALKGTRTMATLAKIEANQGNAKRSTGPRMCSRDKTESSYRSPHGHPLRSLPRHRAMEDTQAIHVSSSSPAPSLARLGLLPPRASLCSGPLAFLVGRGGARLDQTLVDSPTEKGG